MWDSAALVERVREREAAAVGQGLELPAQVLVPPRVGQNARRVELGHLAVQIGRAVLQKLWHLRRRRRVVAEDEAVANLEGSGRLLAGVCGHPKSLLLVEVTFERVEATGPELAIGLEPRVDLSEGLGVEAVHTALRVLADANDARFPERAQMLRDARLADRQALDQLPDGTLAITEQIQDPPARRLGHKLKGRRHGRYITR